MTRQVACALEIGRARVASAITLLGRTSVSGVVSLSLAVTKAAVVGDLRRMVEVVAEETAAGVEVGTAAAGAGVGRIAVGAQVGEVRGGVAGAGAESMIAEIGKAAAVVVGDLVEKALESLRE